MALQGKDCDCLILSPSLLPDNCHALQHPILPYQQPFVPPYTLVPFSWLLLLFFSLITSGWCDWSNIRQTIPSASTYLIWSNEHEGGYQLSPIPSEVGGVLLGYLKQKTWPGALLVSSLNEYLCLWFCQHDPTLILLANPTDFLWKMQLERIEMIACLVPAVNLLGSFHGSLFVSLILLYW